MTITADILKTIAPACKKVNEPRLIEIADKLNEWFPAFEIDTVQEIRHFIAQVAHESDSFNALAEYASGQLYEGRKDLGNTLPGDGVRFKGRGLIQVTGRSIYIELGKKAGNSAKFIEQPSLLETPYWATWSACVYWDSRDLNTFANMIDETEIPVKRLNKSLSPLEYITWRINGGVNGLDQRKRFYQRAKAHIL